MSIIGGILSNLFIDPSVYKVVEIKQRYQLVREINENEILGLHLEQTESILRVKNVRFVHDLFDFIFPKLNEGTQIRLIRVIEGLIKGSPYNAKAISTELDLQTLLLNLIKVEKSRPKFDRMLHLLFLLISNHITIPQYKLYLSVMLYQVQEQKQHSLFSDSKYYKMLQYFKKSITNEGSILMFP